MQIEVKNISGERVKQLELPESIYDVEMNDHLLHNVVKAYRANRRQGTHATKTRSLVSGGGRKPFRQKGTGNARQGSTRAINMSGGAVAHGPQPRSYTQKINSKVKKQAMKMALSDKFRHGKLVVVSDFEVSNYSTKAVVRAMIALNVKSAVLTDERKDDFLMKSTRNIHKANARTASELNVEDLLRYESLVISENGLHALHQRLEENRNESI